MISHCELVRLVADSEVPTYVYDLGEIEERLAELTGMADWPIEIFFATMANDHPEVLRAVRGTGHGVFVNSPRHLRAAMEVGFKPCQIVYAATNLTRGEMDVCCNLGLRLILDSLEQLGMCCDSPRSVSAVGLRVNVGSALDGKTFRQDPEYRFGIPPGQLPMAFRLAARAGIRITGVHSYFGTDLMSAALLLAGLQRLASAATTLPDIEYIDAGGGFGVGDGNGKGHFNLTEYGREARHILARASETVGREIRLCLEPGRWVCAECGVFVVRVVDRKMAEDRVFIGTNGSVAQFPRPLVHPQTARHGCRLIGDTGGRAIHDLPIDVCGNSTFSRDVLARGVRMPLPQPGETLALHPAGAYCRSMITEFLGKDRPREVILRRPRGSVSAPAQAIQ